MKTSFDVPTVGRKPLTSPTPNNTPLTGPDEEILLQNVQKAMDDLSTITSWIVVTFFFTLVQLFRGNREIEIGSFKIGPARVNFVLQLVVVIQIIQMTWLFLRILGNVELITNNTAKLRTILNTHPWFFNPFSDFEYQFVGEINFFLLQGLIFFILLIRRSDILFFKYTARENWLGLLRISSFTPIVFVAERISSKTHVNDLSQFHPSIWAGCLLVVLIWFLREFIFTRIAAKHFKTFADFDARKKIAEEDYYEMNPPRQPSTPKPDQRTSTMPKNLTAIVGGSTTPPEVEVLKKKKKKRWKKKKR